MIKVCDAIMGSGKSSAAINYMNGHPDRKFIYISPYTSEDARIVQACPACHFVEPQESWFWKEENEDGLEVIRSRKGKRSKTQHTAQLIREGRNIATTHQAFLFYTEEMLEDIRGQEYTLIIDEDVQVISQYMYHRADLEILESGGYIRFENDEYMLVRKPEGISAMSEILRILESRNLIVVNGGKNWAGAVMWEMPVRLINAFKDVYILTYMFEGQALYNLLRINNMSYMDIGIMKDDSGYHFDDSGATNTSGHAATLARKIHIYDREKANRIGDEKTALSKHWFATHPEDVEKLSHNIVNYFRYAMGTPAEKRLWTTFKSASSKIARKGIRKGFVVLNKKATNEYSDRNTLVYAANVYMTPVIKNYYRRNGLEVNEDMYALSTMVQWIFRSAIRNGEDVWIYVPSRRMRELLEGWLQGLMRGGDGTGTEQSA